jgi:hypothetical protein
MFRKGSGESVCNGLDPVGSPEPRADASTVVFDEHRKAFGDCHKPGVQLLPGEGAKVESHEVPENLREAVKAAFIAGWSRAAKELHGLELTEEPPARAMGTVVASDVATDVARCRTESQNL